jgi:hypothetical protein
MEVTAALRRTRELVASSPGSPWAQEDPESILQALDAAIAALESGGRVDRPTLRRLFAPTGAIQETSIDGGWGEEFLALCLSVDALLAAG